MMYSETKLRTFTKTVLWRIVATLITWGTLYAYTGRLGESTKITTVAAIIGMAAYYIYERVWNRIQWGKTADKDLQASNIHSL